MKLPALHPVRGWLPLLLLSPAVFAAGLGWQWPAWVTMWAVAAAVFAGCKWLTWRRTPTPAPVWFLAYLFGGRPRRPAFLYRSGQRRTPREWVSQR